GDSPILRGFGAPEGVERETFGFGARRDWRALRSSHGAPAGFEVFHRNRPWGQVTLSVPGRHSVANALAAIALAEGLGIPRSAICEGLRLFPGIERRFQHLGAVGGIDLVDDYAHHPTELSSTLATAREVFPGRRVWAVFQPHQLGRLRAFGGAFAAALGAADGVGLLPIYSVREEASDFPGNLLGELEEGVRRNGVPVVRFHSLVEASDSLTALMEPGDVCLTLGAGDLRPLTEGLRRRLGGGWSGC
ncbi:MAG: glutamate ligase domain-containing protein, partial [Planctomycetota bacterium]